MVKIRNPSQPGDSKSIRIKVPVPPQQAVEALVPRHTLTVRVFTTTSGKGMKSAPLGGVQVSIGTTIKPTLYGTKTTNAYGEAKFPNIPKTPSGKYYVLTIPPAKGCKVYRKNFTMPRYDTTLKVKYTCK